MCGFPLGSPVSFHIPAACKGPMARDTLCRLANMKQSALVLRRSHRNKHYKGFYFFVFIFFFCWHATAVVFCQAKSHVAYLQTLYQVRLLQIRPPPESNITFNVRQYCKITGRDWLFSILTFLDSSADNAFRHWVKTDVSSHYVDIHNKPLLL